MINITKQQNESELQYIWRICSAKDSGILELNWEQVADILNNELREEDEYWTSSAYRKKYQQARSFYDDVFSKMENDSFIEELDSQKRELERLKIQYRDERNAWNKQNYTAARIEQKLDYLEEQLKDISNVEFPKTTHASNGDDTDLICCLSDLHIGQTFDSTFGEYNTDIAVRRLSQYADKVIEIGKRHNSKNIWIMLLGDEISGSIHLTIQVSNRENVIDQIKCSAQLITKFIYIISQYFENVFVVGASGNHSRLVTNKEMAVHDERLDTLITWIIEQMTYSMDNVHVLNRNLDSGICDIQVRGNNYIGCHGDYDATNQNGIGKLCMMLGWFPYAIITGHRHFPMSTEINGIKVIQSGSLAGSGDTYTIEKRLSGKPNQTTLVCNDNGIQCIYNVELN